MASHRCVGCSTGCLLIHVSLDKSRFLHLTVVAFQEGESKSCKVSSGLDFEVTQHSFCGKASYKASSDSESDRETPPLVGSSCKEFVAI